MTTLTKRERDVVMLLAQGKSPSQIAEELCIQRATVWRYAQIAREKTQTASTVELAVKAAIFRQSTQ